MKRIIGIVVLLALANVVCAEMAPEEEWGKTFGGTDYDRSYSVQQTSDGGYIIAGTTESYGAGNGDFWLVKTDSNGNKQWDKTFGGTNIDGASSVQQTSDGGYILAGYTGSYGAGNFDFWLVKTDSEGNKEWDRTFGGTSRDEAYSVQQTSDGGYIITGSTEIGGYDFWLVKTDSNGNKQWNATFGGISWDVAHSVQQTSDGGYIFAGYTGSYGAGFTDAWLVKTDSEGHKVWDKTFGGANTDSADSVQQTSDGGYILAGNTYSYGAGRSDFWLVKTDSDGNKQWDKTFGGSNDDDAYNGLDDYCSYAYAFEMNEQTASESVIVADKSWSNDDTKKEAGSEWEWLGTSSILPNGVNHKTDGVNVLFVGGDVKWLPSGKISEVVTNTDNLIGSTDGTKEAGELWNP